MQEILKRWKNVRRWLVLGWMCLVVVTEGAGGEIAEQPGGDHWIEPIAFSHAVSILVVLFAITGLAASAFKIWRTSEGMSRKGLVGLVITAMLTGYGYRLVTASVSGANIGGALFVMLIGPVIMFWLIMAGFSIRKSIRS